MPIHSEVARLLPEGPMVAPKAGRRRVHGGEWDWYYQLTPARRRRVLRYCCAPGGLAPDQCARAAGFDDVDEWADELVAVLDVSDNPDTGGVTLMVAASDLVGPVEVAALCEVKVDTVYQWVARGRLSQPVATVSGTRLWLRHDVETWAFDSGRLMTDCEVF